MKRLDIVVGSNGSVRSTFVALTPAPLLPGSVFVNADEIAKSRWPEDAAVHSYEAARIAADTRAALIPAGRSFIAETVFSHRSKLDLIDVAHHAGFVVALHCLLVPEDLAVQRVRYRVRAGGRFVPEDKIRGPYQRLWSLVAEAVRRCDLGAIYDNSRRQGPQIVAQYSHGHVVGSAARPDWTPPALINP